MNQHIELVKKWLKDKDAVSLEELEANKETAYAAYAAAKAAAASSDAAAAADYYADYWVKQYEERIK